MKSITKKLVAVILSIILLFTGIFCFVGCEEKEEEPISLTLLVYEESDPNNYICELTEEDNYKEITLDFNRENRFFCITARYPNGEVKSPEWQGLSPLVFSGKFLKSGNENEWEDFYYVYSKGTYVFDCEVHDTYEELNLKYFHARLIIYIV